MIPKLQAEFTSRIPVVIRKKGNTVYFQVQYEIAREDGLCAGIYSEFSKCEEILSSKEIGKLVIELIREYNRKADLSINSGYSQTSIEEKLTYMGVMSDKELYDKFIICLIWYELATKKYSFGLNWITKEGKSKYYDSSDSKGDKKYKMYETALEFYDDVEPEVLGGMVFEALRRSEEIGKIAGGNHCPKLEIELLDESILKCEGIVDKDFENAEDVGVAEIYQGYACFNDSDELIADIYLGIAPEYDCDLSMDNVKKALEDAYGALDEFIFEQSENGIFTYVLEARNKKIHKKSYLLVQEEDLLLECTMEVNSPNRRKKMDEKVKKLFEKFALGCRF